MQKGIITVIAVLFVVVCVIALALEIQFDYLAYKRDIQQGKCLVLDSKISRVSQEDYDEYDLEVKISLIPSGPERWVIEDTYIFKDSAEKERTEKYYVGNKVTCYYLDSNAKTSLHLGKRDAIPDAPKWGVGILTVILFCSLVLFGFSIYIEHLN